MKKVQTGAFLVGQSIFFLPIFNFGNPDPHSC